MKRISEGDFCAGFDLAQFFLTHVDDNNVQISLAVVEGLVRQSAQLGSNEAEVFLKEQWPTLQNIMAKRLIRRGFK